VHCALRCIHRLLDRLATSLPVTMMSMSAPPQQEERVVEQQQQQEEEMKYINANVYENQQASFYPQQPQHAAQFACLFTKQKTQKRKIWLDGRLVVTGIGVTLHSADPPPGSGDPVLDQTELTRQEVDALLAGQRCNLDLEKHLITIEGPWTGAVSTHTQKVAPLVSSAMQKVMTRKFRKPVTAAPPPPPMHRPIPQAKRRRPLQPGELVRSYYGHVEIENQSNQQHHFNNGPPPLSHHDPPAAQGYPQPQYSYPNSNMVEPQVGSYAKQPLYASQGQRNLPVESPGFQNNCVRPSEQPTRCNSRPNPYEPTMNHCQQQPTLRSPTNLCEPPANQQPLSHPMNHHDPWAQLRSTANHLAQRPPPATLPGASQPPQQHPARGPVRIQHRQQQSLFSDNGFNARSFYGEDFEEEDEEEEEGPPDTFELQMTQQTAPPSRLDTSSLNAGNMASRFKAGEDQMKNNDNAEANSNNTATLSTTQLLDLFETSNTKVGGDEFVLPPQECSSDEEST
jgi:Protein of unknown function (DUF2439)